MDEKLIETLVKIAKQLGDTEKACNKLLGTRPDDFDEKKVRFLDPAGIFNQPVYMYECPNLTDPKRIIKNLKQNYPVHRESTFNVLSFPKKKKEKNKQE